MDAADLDVVRSLMAQLDYDITADDLAARFGAVTGDPDPAVLVAEQGGLLLGLVHVFARAALEKPMEAVLQSLWVDAPGARAPAIGPRPSWNRAEWLGRRPPGGLAFLPPLHPKR